MRANCPLPNRCNVRLGCAPWKGGAFQWVQIPPGKPLQPEATGAVMEETKWLKPAVFSFSFALPWWIKLAAALGNLSQT
jgi:hypothetical protein